MSEYEISDYGIFNDAVGTVNKVSADILTAKTTGGAVKDVVSDEAVFMGPIAQYCTRKFETVLQNFNTSSTDFKTLGSYLIKVSDNYQKADQAASKTIGSGSGGNTIDISKYTSKGNFVVTTGNTTYNLSDAEKDTLYGIVAAESDKSYDDALAVISVILNRCESPAWSQQYGKNPVAQVKAPYQFEVYQGDGRGMYANYTGGRAPETVTTAVNDALAGVRNNEFLSFKANWVTSVGNNMITNTGNRYHN